MSRQPFNPRGMPLDGIRLVEASAGTGKTFSLAGLYLRLLVEQRLSVREILVMTFTRAATQELRERIRQRLVDAARIAQAPETADPDSPEDAFAEAVIAGGEEHRADVARRLAEAAHRMDEATITTIHGFSQRAAAENAFDSALPFDRGEQVDDKTVYDEATADYWRARALGTDGDLGFVDWWPTPDDLGNSLRDFWTRPHAGLAGPKDDETEALAQRVREAWSKDGAAFEEAWRRSWADDDLLKTQSLYKAIDKCGGIDEALALLRASLDADRTVPSLPAWLAHLTSAEKQFKKNRRERGESLLGEPLALDLCRLQPLARLSALRRALSAIRATAAGRKRERRQFSFSDMTAALHDAVTDERTGPRLAEALHTTWPWALVDEFQDTDPLQYEILQRVYARRDTGGLILIGDPKQAIFGFRGGDVYAYLGAAADAGDRAYSLDTNYRSTQAVLDGIEALFRMPDEDSFLVDGIDYQSVQAGRPDERTLELGGSALPALTVWHMAAEDERKGDATGACRDACVGEIRRLLDPESGGVVRKRDDSGERTRALEPHDIAVLVNTNAQASDMQRALSDLGIPAVCLHQDSVFDSGEALDVLHVLKAAASPTDEGVLRGALAGDLLGFRLSGLVALIDDERRWQAATERFQRAHENWRDDGVLAMLQPLIQDAAERLLGYVDGERRMSNYLQLAELLAQAESGTFGMSGLLRWLRRAIRDADEKGGADAEQLRLESDEALVRIATVHKAKGLEYPVVFLPFAPWLGAMGRPDKPPHQFHDDDGHALIDIVGTDEAREQAIREARAEGLRLLYVALTRAELACFLPWGAANGTPDSALASLLHREDVPPTVWGGQANAKPLTDELARERLTALAEHAPHAIEVGPLPRDAGTTGRLPAPSATPGKARTDLPGPRSPWSVFSFTRLVRAAGPEQAMPGADDEADAPEPEPTETRTPLPELPGGVAFGSAVHALLETADPAAWPVSPDAVPSERLDEVRDRLRDHGIPLPAGQPGETLVERTAELVRNALHTPLPGIGPLAEVPPTAQLTEMEFMLRLAGRPLGDILDVLNEAGYAAGLPRDRQAELLRGLMHGFIDLVVERDGRYYVIDHKTNWLGPNAEDYHAPALEAAIQHRHYDLQYLIYVTALHRHLRRRLAGYDPERHLGGVLYLFLRGMAPDAGERGVFVDCPDPGLIERLDALLDARGDAA